GIIQDTRCHGTNPVDRPRSWTLRREVEREPAVDDCQLSAVDVRPEAVRRVTHEVSEGHQAAEDKCGGPGRETDRHQHVAKELDRAGGPDDCLGCSGGHAAEDTHDFCAPWHAIKTPNRMRVIPR